MPTFRHKIHWPAQRKWDPSGLHSIALGGCLFLVLQIITAHQLQSLTSQPLGVPASDLQYQQQISPKNKPQLSGNGTANKLNLASPELISQQELRHQQDNLANGTTILEDLVNQFIERNHQAFKRTNHNDNDHHDGNATAGGAYNGGQVAGDSINNNRSNYEDDEAINYMGRFLAPNGPQLDTLVQVESEPQESGSVSSQSTLMPALSSTTTLNSGPENESLLASIKPTVNDSLVDKLAEKWDPEDRHIPYDTMILVGNTDTINQLAIKPNSLVDSNQQEAVLANLNDNKQQEKPIKQDSQTKSVGDKSISGSSMMDKGKSTSQVDESNLASLADNQEDSVAESASDTEGSLMEHHRSGDVQARSMSNSRLLQHSKPPYATYNQFQPRVEVAPTLSVSNENRFKSNNYKGETKDNPNKTQLPEQLVANETSVAKQNSTIINTISSKKQPFGSNLIDDQQLDTNSSKLTESLNKISSHLFADEMENSVAKPQVMDFVAPLSSNDSSNSSEQRPVGFNLIDRYNGTEDNKSPIQANKNPDQADQDELERAVQKLAPINEPVLLDPIPIDRDTRLQQQQQPQPLMNLSHDLSIQQLEPKHQVNQNLPRDRITREQQQSFSGSYSWPLVEDGNIVDGRLEQLDKLTNTESKHDENDHGEPLDRIHESPLANDYNRLSLATGSKTTTANSIHSINDSSKPKKYASKIDPVDDLQQDEPLIVPQRSDFSHVLHKKTLDSVHDQLRGDHNYSTANQDHKYYPSFKERQHVVGPATLQHQQPPTLIRSGGAGSGNYVASLVNITAPILSPLSASEAMEADTRLASSMLLGSTHQATDKLLPSRRLPGHQYPVPFLGYAMPGHEQPIYSQPANQFTPKPTISSSAAIAANSAPPTFALVKSMATTPSYLESINYQQQQKPTLTPPPSPLLSSGSSLSPSDQVRKAPPSATSEQLMVAASGFIGQMRKPLGVNQQASGFRSPLSQPHLYHHLHHHHHHQHNAASGSSMPIAATTSLPMPSSYLNSVLASQTLSQSTSGAPGGSSGQSTVDKSVAGNSSGTISGQQTFGLGTNSPMATTNGFITSGSGSNGANGAPANGNTNTTVAATANIPADQAADSSPVPSTSASSSISSSTSDQASSSGIATATMISTPQASAASPSSNGQPISALNKRLTNLTRVEHISAECSNDLIRTVIIFNGTFKGIIYSSGYVRDSNCLYVNGTGAMRYDFSIHLNQCGTIGRQEIHAPNGPNELRRRDQIMWNTLSIQYNPIIEQEWDEHFRVSCEYGSDFWKTISFNPFNVETNTGSPMIFTVDPPQCQMEILRGHGMIGPRQEAISGPVTVGDPLTLLIHMKSEKAGYDILVKNCIAHNGGQQKMQLIDSNGCVVNERFISPFRGTYNDNELKHVTLYAYLKAFRFTGSPVLYLECEVHMCQSSCPPQMCYWRRLSKRSTDHNDTTRAELDFDVQNYMGGLLDLHEDRFENSSSLVGTNTPSGRSPSTRLSNERQARKMTDDGNLDNMSITKLANPSKKRRLNNDKKSDGGNVADKISLFQALEVRQERDTDATPLSSPLSPDSDNQGADSRKNLDSNHYNTMCFRQTEIFALLSLLFLALLISISVTIACCLRASNLRALAIKKVASYSNLSRTTLGAYQSRGHSYIGSSVGPSEGLNLPFMGTGCGNYGKIFNPPRQAC